jgi:antitoxin CcdA
MIHVYDKKAPKQAVDLNVNRDLLEAAREAGVNLSAILEEALAEKLADAKRELWVRENSDAIADYNDLVEEQGVMSDGTRSF